MTLLAPHPLAIQTKLNPAVFSGRTVAFCLHEPLSSDEETEQYGFFFASGSQENAIVMIVPRGPDGEAQEPIRLWQSAVDCIRKANPGLPYEFTCFMQAGH